MKHWTLAGGLLFVIVSALLVPTVFAAAPGAGPNDALMVTGTWQSIAANSSAWFYFDYTGDRSQVEVDLDTYGVGNVQLKVYTPDQAKAWLSDQTTAPIGLGGKNQFHDLVWTGKFNFPGRFFAVVVNNNPFAVQIRLTVQGDAVILAPPPTATPIPTPLFKTPAPASNVSGRLVFQQASGGDIYTVNGDGTNLKRVTSGIDPSWSPDGKQITFARWGAQAGIYVANADGTNEHAIAGSMTQPLSPRFSPNGAKIVYTRQTGGSLNDQSFCFGRFCFNLPADPYWRLGAIDANTRAQFDVKSSNHSFAPSWKNDNNTIAYADAQFGVMITNVSGDKEWTIYKLNPAVQSTAYSPDGKKIAFAARMHDHWDVQVLDLDTGNLIPVTQPNPLAFRADNNVAPVWSPDGKQILFLSDRNGKWEFFVANPDGTNLQQVLKSVSDSLPITFNFNNERVIDWIK
jgi:hypothetical protein